MTSRPSTTPIRNLTTSTTIFCRACISRAGTAAKGQWWYKSTDFWEFFLGPALSIAFLALPWVLVEPRNRLLLAQVALSAVGLWVIVYYHAHYAAPLMATVFVLIMQCMRVLRRLRFLGRAVGVALTRLIVLLG